MKKKQAALIKQNDIVRIIVGTGFMLLIPLIAMQFTNDIKWGIFDFITIGILLFITGFLLKLASKTPGKYKYLVFAGILFLVLLSWGELAVGIFGTPFSGN